MGIQGKIEIINLIQNGFDELLQDAELSNPQNRNRRGLWSRKFKIACVMLVIIWVTTFVRIE